MTISDELRIDFMKSAVIDDSEDDDPKARKDKDTFKRWENRGLTTLQAAQMIAKNNRCSVSAKQFEANAIMLGYWPRVSWENNTSAVKYGKETHYVEPMHGYDLHRFVNAAGTDYSAIYVNGFEMYSVVRSRERDMLEYWYNK